MGVPLALDCKTFCCSPGHDLTIWFQLGCVLLCDWGHKLQGAFGDVENKWPRRPRVQGFDKDSFGERDGKGALKQTNVARCCAVEM